MDHNDGNFIVSWDLHFDYEIAPDTLPGFHPLLEIHALHYVSNADRAPLDFGGLDYTNLGSSDVAGDLFPKVHNLVHRHNNGEYHIRRIGKLPIDKSGDVRIE